MKKAFSLLEIIIGILIIGLISSFAIPKLMETKDFASATTLKRDIFSIVSSAQTYNLANATFDIEQAIQINESTWELKDKVLADNSKCVKISFGTSTINIASEKSTDKICVKLYEDINLGDDDLTYEM